MMTNLPVLQLDTRRQRPLTDPPADFRPDFLLDLAFGGAPFRDWLFFCLEDENAPPPSIFAEKAWPEAKSVAPVVPSTRAAKRRTCA